MIARMRSSSVFNARALRLSASATLEPGSGGAGTFTGGAPAAIAPSQAPLRTPGGNACRSSDDRAGISSSMDCTLLPQTILKAEDETTCISGRKGTGKNMMNAM
mmetsp:Transcript_12789/g.29431  ORF Transcript_12789/g.29431 Transcript_12789/m.29431 type:complete len:104 (-) Transcript_12789:454-765(-)